MAREDLHFRLRIPESLKAQVEAEASANRRSMTAEIIHRLETSFGRQEEGVRSVWLPAELWARVEDEANITETDPNELIVEAVDKTFPSQADIADKLVALTRDLNRRGLEQTPEGREILGTLDKLIERRDQLKQEEPQRPWKKG